MANPQEGSDSDGPIINDNVIRIQLRKPQHRNWELRTRNKSPGATFPIIQLFDCEGNILVETNDDNVSIRSSDCHEGELKASQSLNERDYKHIIHPNGLKKSNTIAGSKIYTRLFSPKQDDKANLTVKNLRVVIPSRQNSDESLLPSSDVCSEREYSSFKSSDNESSSPDTRHTYITSRAGTLLISPNKNVHSPFRRRRTEEDEVDPPAIEKNCNPYDSRQSRIRLQRQQSIDEHDDRKLALHKSKSFHSPPREQPVRTLAKRSKTDILPSSKPIFSPPTKKVSFLDTYLRSLPKKENSIPGWLEQTVMSESTGQESEKLPRTKCSPSLSGGEIFRGNERQQLNPQSKHCQIAGEMADSEVLDLSSDALATAELNRRLRLYRRGVSEAENADKGVNRTRRRSEGDYSQSESSSESPDEADAVLNRLRRRILRNKSRAKQTLSGNFEQRTNQKRILPQAQLIEQSSIASSLPEDTVEPHALLKECLRPTTQQKMGSNISHHSVKGLTGRRARSSGDLCNGDTKSQTESSVYGSVVGEVMGWNRSLPNHLDGNRHLASEYNGSLPRGNNNYGEGCRYHPKGVRAWRYRASKAASEVEREPRAGSSAQADVFGWSKGSDADPVWKLQDPGCDQGYGSERSPEEDFPPAARHTTYEEYEAQLRLMYPFITEDNTFTVVVEKDGRGLGMSVSGGDEGGGLVRIRRLYPPQPAWRTGRLAPRDLLLAANGVPLTGLTTYEALEVLRTTAPRVELRVCRPPPDVMDCLTPPAPPTPPTRHTPAPPPDPLNCHPLHTRLSATTSSATTSSSEGRFGAGSASGMRRDDAPSPDPQGGYDRPDSLRLPDLEQPLPVYDVQYGDDGSVEFDIIMTKVNGSLGFTLRKEDHSALGHYVRALVREPALSDGRIQPGDRIVAVNEVSMSGMSHADAVSFLRSCGAEVRLRLYRDNAATPLSPLSPQESHERQSPSDSDTATVRPKPHLRQEAVNMLCDLAARRLTPDAATADGSRSPCLSPRKYRRLTRDSTGQSQGSDIEPYTVVCPTSTDTNSDSEPGPPARAPRPQHLPCRPLRPYSLNLGGPPTPINCRKQKLTLTVAPHGYELNNLDNDVLDAPNVYQDGRCQTVGSHYLSTGNFQSDISTEPISMPVGMPSGNNQHFMHKNPAYQSAVVHPSSNDNSTGNDSYKDDGNGLKKWKGVTLSPDKERKAKPEIKPKTMELVQKENLKPVETAHVNEEPTILTVELNRGWNSRLGFSIQSHPESGQSYVSAIYSDSVAARDGRLRKGDVILQVNDENVTSMKTSEVIDLMRILRGSICITVLRPSTQ